MTGVSNENFASTIEFIIGEIKLDTVKEKAMAVGLIAEELGRGYRLLDAETLEEITLPTEAWPEEWVLDYCNRMQTGLVRGGMFIP